MTAIEYSSGFVYEEHCMFGSMIRNLHVIFILEYPSSFYQYKLKLAWLTSSCNFMFMEYDLEICMLE
jgi:hypothetical protein